MTDTSKPRIRVRRAGPADVDAIMHVYEAAFGPGIMHQLIYGGTMTEDAKQKYRTSLFPAPGADTKAGSGERVIMLAELVPASESESARVVAYGKWFIWRQPRPASEWNDQKAATQEELGEGASPAFFNQFIGGLHAMRNRFAKGDPGFYLSTLACDPSFGRLGAGSALLRWGRELADREGLVSWLEASAQGYPLYRRLGFVPVDTLDVDLATPWNVTPDGSEDWGTNSAPEMFGPKPETVYRTVLMRRGPEVSS